MSVRSASGLPQLTPGTLGRRDIEPVLRRIRLALGLLLLGVSTLAVVEAVHELVLWEIGHRRYEETSFRDRTVRFAGHRLDVIDDQPFDSTQREREFPGIVQVLLNDRPVGPASRAHVRRGRNDLGRYHLWINGWVFTNKHSRTRSLWLTRRLEPEHGERPRFELIVISEDGTVQRSEKSSWELARDYPTFRSTQFLREGAIGPFALKVLDLAVLPMLWLIFPIGSFVIGVLLVWSCRESTSAA